MDIQLIRDRLVGEMAMLPDIKGRAILGHRGGVFARLQWP